MKLIPRFGVVERCPLCREVVGEELAVHVCPTCSTTLHQVCREELGGCATLGCDARGSMKDQEIVITPERVRHLRGLVTEELIQNRPWWAHTGLRGFLTALAIAALGAGLILFDGTIFARGGDFDFGQTPICYFGIMIVCLSAAMFLELLSGRRASAG